MALFDFIQIVFFFLLLFLLTPFLGAYIARVYLGQTTILSVLLQSIEKRIYSFCSIDPQSEMNARQYSVCVLIFSFIGFCFVFLLQLLQDKLPFNPQHLEKVPMSLAFNTAISFVSNTNWQAYSGEIGLSYFVQSFGLTVQNFMSAGVGMAVSMAFTRALTRSETNLIGNFWVDLNRAILHVLLPLSLILAFLLVSQGVIQNFNSYMKILSLEGNTQVLPMGPVASQVAIKQLGSNGGGFFASNSAHPFENSTPLSNLLQMLAIVLIPSALVYAFGVLTNAKRHAFLLYYVILSLLVLSLAISLVAEQSSNPALNLVSSMEGKEQRFGVINSILWSTLTTATSNGSVNAMHDSLSPLAGGVALAQMLLGEIVFGGVGSGLYGILLFVLLTVFLASLMVGRTPEYFGKKIEQFEIQMVLIGILTPSLLVLSGSGMCMLMPDILQNLANAGPHGLSQIVYAWASTANNNGSSFAGLNVNTDFFNFAFAFAMLVGRFSVLIPILFIAERLASKRSLSVSASTLAVDNFSFGFLLIAVILLVGALTFFPAFVLGPLAEHFLMMSGETF